MRARFFLLACVFASQVQAAESWAQVVVNGEVKPDLTLVDADGKGGVLVQSADAATWSLPAALSVSAEVLDPRERVRVQSRPGVGVEFKDDEQRLEITIAPWLLPANELSAARGNVMPEEGMRAFFVNYDVQAQRGEGTAFAARGEAGFSVGRALTLTSVAELPRQSPRRLDSQVRIDYPEHQATLMLGDTISRGAALGSAFRFGGIQWATEFATTPDFIPFAVPTMRGVATVPSTVDLMINGTLVAQRDVPAGAFAFNDLPGITGRGAVEMRVRDAFGNESVVTQSFLAAPSVLRQGVNAYSLEAGFVRENYGLHGDRYGAPFVSGDARRGLTDRVTGEAGLQVGRDVNVGSLGAAARVSSLLMLESTVSAGHSPNGNGSAASARAASYLGNLEAAVQYRVQSLDFPDFARPGFDSGFRREWSGQISARLPANVSFAASRIARSGGTDSRGTQLTVLSLSRSRIWGGSLGLQASRVAGPNGQFVWSLMYARQTAGRSETAQLSGDPRGLSLTAQTGADSGRGPGIGWQVAGRAGENASVDAHGTMRTQYGYGDAEAAQMGDQHLARVAWHGGWLHAGDVTRVTEPLTGAIGVIEAPGLADVRVQRDGEDLGRTDSQGRLIATNLRAFDRNVVRLDTSTLTADDWIDEAEQTVRPFWRGVVAVRFASTGDSFAARLRRPNGAPVPAGARVTEPKGNWPVGEEGLVSLPMDRGLQRLRVEYPTGACVVSLGPVLSRLRSEVLELVCE